MRQFVRSQRGQVVVAIAVIVAILLVFALVTLVAPVFTTTTLASQINGVEKSGYVVLSPADYATLLSKVNAIKAKTDGLPATPADEATAAAAVIAAQDAADAAQSAADVAQETPDRLLLYNENEIFLYPDTSSRSCTLTAGSTPSVFGAWTEIVDSLGTTLTSKFAANSGYIREIMTHNYSIADEIYIVEIGYGASHTIIGRVKVRSDWTYVLPPTATSLSPANQIIYYRMMCETGDATLRVDFRYYFQ